MAFFFERKKIMSETSENIQLGSLNINEIMALLPHRYPFLLVDKIIDIDGDKSAIGIKNVTINEPFFQGHFPTHPIMPGVLIVEAMAQVAGAICAHSAGDQEETKIVYFMSIDSCKFKKPVLPGDVLNIHVIQTQSRRNIWKFSCKAMVNDKLHAQADIAIMAP